MLEDLLQPRHLFGLFSLAALFLGIYYLLTLKIALDLCAAESRSLTPWKVWLTLIPLFNIVWHFIVVVRISRSLRNEFNRRGTPDIEANPGKAIGLAMCILAVCAALLPRNPTWTLADGVEISILPVLAFLSGFVCWIVYWVKIYRYATLLKAASNNIASAAPA